MGEFHGNFEVAGNGGDDAQPNGKAGPEAGNPTLEAGQQFSVPYHLDVVVVQNVRSASPAADAGIQPGDVILENDRKPTDPVRKFAAELRENKVGKDVLMLVWSKGSSSDRTIHSDQGTAYSAPHMRTKELKEVSPK